MDSNVIENKKRPGWVWAISIFFFFSAAYSLLSIYLVSSGKIPLQPAQKAYFDSLTFIDYGLTILLGLTNLTGAVLLFLLRKQAFYLFAVAFAANVLMTVWHIVSKGFIAAVSSVGLIGMLIG
jgi:hypothetical protein